MGLATQKIFYTFCRPANMSMLPGQVCRTWLIYVQINSISFAGLALYE